jgi:hypothetical protein
VNRSASDVGEVPPTVLTLTSTVPVPSGGLVAVISVGESTTKAAAGVPPKSTAVTPWKLEPVIVTLVPPESGPSFGLTADTVGAAT